MALGMRFGHLCCLCAPVPILLFSLSVGVQFELANQRLETALVFDGHKASLKEICQVPFLSLGRCTAQILGA